MGENKYLDLDGLKNLVDNIKSGNLVSGKSISDASGNSITDTYATKEHSNGLKMSLDTLRGELDELDYELSEKIITRLDAPDVVFIGYSNGNIFYNSNLVLPVGNTLKKVILKCCNSEYVV